jgi:hypothetical protein
VTLPFAHT